MCVGCGLCANDQTGMFINSEGFLRPVNHARDELIDRCCPGGKVGHFNSDGTYDVTWGPLLRVLVGAATDTEVRNRASSGGVITALLLHLLQRSKVDAVVQIGVKRGDPIGNQTYVVCSKSEVLANAGSRYGPSAPLVNLMRLAEDSRTYAIVGKPCDVAAVRAVIQNRPELKGKFPYLISFMCAGVPSERGTEAILRKLNVNREDLVSFRYRGEGWPGLTRAVTKKGTSATLTYSEAWGDVLNQYLQRRCKLCADGIGEAADVVCADAWYQSADGSPLFDEKEGRSLILVRTRLGLSIVEDAERDLAIATEEYDVANLLRIQEYQAQRKHTALARTAAIRVLGGRVTSFYGYRLWKAAIRGGGARNFVAFIGALRRKVIGRL